jgi:hypothetical protein
MGRLDTMRKLSALAAMWLITYLVLATLVLGEVPFVDPETAQPAFSGLAQFAY